MKKTLILFLILFMSVSTVFAAFGLLKNPPESVYTKTVNKLGSQAGSSTMIYAATQMYVHKANGEQTKHDELKKLLLKTITEKKNDQIPFNIKKMEEVHEYITENPADFDKYLSNADTQDVLGAALNLSAALNETKEASATLNELSKMKPDKQDALYAAKGKEIADFTASSQSSQIQSITNILQSYKGYLQNKAVDLNTALSGVTTETVINELEKLLK